MSPPADADGILFVVSDVLVPGLCLHHLDPTIRLQVALKLEKARTRQVRPSRRAPVRPPLSASALPMTSRRAQSTARAYRPAPGDSPAAPLAEGPLHEGGVTHPRPSRSHRLPVMFPASTKESLSAHLEGIEERRQVHLSDGYGEVYLPSALARKYPGAARQWACQ